MLDGFRKCVELQWPLLPMRPFVGLYNPFDRSYRQDPYPHLDRLRSEAPVYFSRPVGSYLVSSHAGVHAVFSDTRFTSDRKMDTSFRNRMTYRMMRLSSDEAAAFDASLPSVAPDVHERMRAAIRHDFSRAHVEEMRPVMQRWVDHLLDRAAARGSLDLIADFAAPLPILIAAELLGLPPEDAKQLQEWSDSFIILVDPLIEGVNVKRMRQAFQEFDSYIVEALKRKEHEPADDLISRLAECRAEGALTDRQVRTLTLMLLTAGHEVITNLIGNAIVSLLRAPAERDRLQQDPSLMPSAIEEFIRLESPIQSAWRIATEELDLGGTTIKPGQAVTVLIGAANHDPDRFADPHRLDVGRADNRHLGFAAGSHHCVGPWLARVEGATAISRFLERFPAFHGDVSKPKWKPAMGLRGLYELPLNL